MADPVDPSSLPYRPAVGILLLNRDNLVFVGRRIDQIAETWQMPQGGIDPGETPTEAALRELEDEVGTAKATVLAESREWFNYDLPAELVGKVWRGRYRGQTQKWFAMRFTGTDQDIDLNAGDPEFSDWRWLTLAEVLGWIVPFKRDVYRRIVAEFGHLIA